MQKERVTNDIFVFTSGLYAQVTAGLVLTEDGVVLIDTLAYPQETRQIKRFVEERLRRRVLYVVNTHYHADHTFGTSFFPEARVVAHRQCRDLLDTRGRRSLEAAQHAQEMPDDVRLILPDMVFDDVMTLHVGEKTLDFWHAPGHSPDSVVCLVREDQVLFAADTQMPVPYFVDGNLSDHLASLRRLQGGAYEAVVQGHGEVVLRGEVDTKLQSDINYLTTLQDAVKRALDAPDSRGALNAISIEACGKNRVLLNGAVQQLHRQNVDHLARQLSKNSDF